MNNFYIAQEKYDNQKPDDYYLDYKLVKIECCECGERIEEEVEFDLRYNYEFNLICENCGELNSI